MKKIYTKSSTQADGSTLVETIIVATGLNTKTLDAKFGIREDGFLDRQNEIELTLSKPKIYLCNSTAIRQLAGAERHERVYVVRQVHSERFV